MISILIPTKDYDCHQLIEELHRQGEALRERYEIIIGEDGTSKENLKLNIAAEFLPNCRRIIREQNIGRANIRNVLAIEAKYPNLLFIDSDAIVEKEDFLKCYTEELKEHEVVCGGLYHTDKQPDRSFALRYKYEKKADKYRSAEIRNKNPYDKFTTFNFAIRKEIFSTIFFNPDIVQYGYEDTLFGKELEKRKVLPIHIDNKLLHNGLEDSATYLSKIEQSIRTLVSIQDRIGTTPLLEAAARLKRWHLKGVFTIFWKVTRRRLVKNLLGSNPSLKIFNIYKLGYFCSLIKQGG